MYISYSGFKKYVTCSFAYWNDYINHTVTDTVDDRLGSIYGSVVGLLFEMFYKDKLWRKSEPQAEVMSRVDVTVDKVLRKETTPWKDRKAGVLLWKGPGKDQNPRGLYADKKELVADVRDAVARGFRIIRHHRLLGPRTDAEFKLDFTTEGHILAGRSDFIIERTKPHNDLVIIDGKGSRHRDKYTDPQQLQWYAMLFWLNSVREGKPRLPDKLAFLFWRYDADKSMDWMDISEGDVVELYEMALKTIREIEDRQKMLLPNASPKGAIGVFTPKANDNNCRFCPYASVCPPGARIQEKLKEKYK
jgi:hypothetical protein